MGSNSMLAISSRCPSPSDTVTVSDSLLQVSMFLLSFCIKCNLDLHTSFVFTACAKVICYIKHRPIHSILHHSLILPFLAFFSSIFTNSILSDRLFRPSIRSSHISGKGFVDLPRLLTFVSSIQEKRRKPCCCFSFGSSILAPHHLLPPFPSHLNISPPYSPPIATARIPRGHCSHSDLKTVASCGLLKIHTGFVCLQIIF